MSTPRYEWYELQSPGLGDEFLNSLYARLERIGSHPKALSVIYKNVRRAVVPKFPYLAFTQVRFLHVLASYEQPAHAVNVPVNLA
jgi:toxin ParE1/3/4